MRRLAAVVFALGVAFTGLSASAADIRIGAAEFAPWHPVPHVHLTGPIEEGDTQRLVAGLDAACARYECDSYSNTKAVLSLDSPGGDFHEGIALAELIRSSQVATIVRNGDRCYSACTLAWLGGSGLHLTGGVGTYIDRYLEPGGVLGFHSPYLAPEGLRHLGVEERFSVQTTGLRLGIAEMVRFLVQYAVSPELVDRLIEMGPDETYDATTVADLVRLKAELPPRSLTELGLSAEEAVWNACRNLLVLHRQVDFGNDVDLVPGFVMDTMAMADGRTLRGYAVDDRPLNTSFCGTAEPVDLRGDGFSVHLVRMAWKDDLSDTFADPLVSLHFSAQAWNSAGYSGGRATASHLRLTPMLSWVLPPELPLNAIPTDRRPQADPMPVTLQQPVSDPFVDVRSPFLPVDGIGPQRDYAVGYVTVRTLVGGTELTEQAENDRYAISDDLITYEKRFDGSFVYSGFTNADRQTGFYRLVLRNGERVAFLDLRFPMTLDGKPLGDAGKTVTSIACGTTFGDAGLPCATR